MIEVTHEDRHWLLNRAVEVDRDDILLMLRDPCWSAMSDDAFDAINRVAQQAGLGWYW